MTWEPPIPFEEVALPPFPVSALPSRVRPYVEAVAETTQTPVDMAGTASLVVMASCIQGKYIVHAKADWMEPTNLYALIIAEPSERKSAVASLMVRPVSLFEMEYNRQHAASLERNLYLRWGDGLLQGQIFKIGGHHARHQISSPDRLRQ